MVQLVVSGFLRSYKEVKVFLSLLILALLPLNIHAQTQRVISGNIIDAATKEPLAFVSVALKKQLIGSLSNSEGEFDLRLAQESETDTLVISYLGYKQQLIPLKSISGALSIKLIESVLDLKEVVVRPWTADFYIRMAMRRIPKNYPNQPFITEAYYREKITENQKPIRFDEGVFKTYYPNYIDTLKTQSQLLLFKRIDNPEEIAFMSKERKKKAEKNKRKGRDTTANGGLQIDLGESFGGPESILKSSDITKNPNNFLDTNKLRSYRYEFAKSGTYNSSELMIITFESKGKVEHVRESGKIYIDMASLAIIKVESNGSFVIPAYIRPLIFLYGIGVENPSYESKTEYRQINGRWHPSSAQFYIDIHVTNKHWFEPDEHSLFQIEQVFGVNKTQTESAQPIPLNKRFKAQNKDLKSQVHNDENLKWEEVNIIRK